MNGFMDHDKALHVCVCVCWSCWYRYKHQQESRAVIGLIPWVALTLSQLSGETSLCTRSECMTRVKSFKFSRTGTCGGCHASFKRTESLHDSYVLLVWRKRRGECNAMRQNKTKQRKQRRSGKTRLTDNETMKPKT